MLLNMYHVQRAVQTDNNLRRLRFKTLLKNCIKNYLQFINWGCEMTVILIFIWYIMKTV